MYEFTLPNSFGSAYMVNFLTVSVYGDQSITKQRFQLKNGACNDAIYSSNFDRLNDNVWGSLTQLYYSCTYKQKDAFVTAVGISASTSGAIVGLAVAFWVGVALCIRECRHQSIKILRKSDENKNQTRSTEEKLNSLIDILDSYECVWGFTQPFGDKLKDAPPPSDEKKILSQMHSL